MKTLIANIKNETDAALLDLGVKRQQADEIHANAYDEAYKKHREALLYADTLHNEAYAKALQEFNQTMLAAEIHFTSGVSAKLSQFYDGVNHKDHSSNEQP